MDDRLSEPEIEQVAAGVLASAGCFGVSPEVRDIALQALHGEITFDEAIEQAAALAKG